MRDYADLANQLSREDRAVLRSALDAADLREAIDAALAGASGAAAPEVSGKPTYTVAEAAEYLQCGTDHVYELIHADELSAARVGRGFTIRAEELDRYLLSQEAGRSVRRIDLARSKRGRKHTNAAVAPAASVGR